jgi:hypothetical protein
MSTAPSHDWGLLKAQAKFPVLVCGLLGLTYDEGRKPEDGVLGRHSCPTMLVHRRNVDASGLAPAPVVARGKRARDRAAGVGMAPV